MTSTDRENERRAADWDKLRLQAEAAWYDSGGNVSLAVAALHAATGKSLAFCRELVEGYRRKKKELQNDGC